MALWKEKASWLEEGILFLEGGEAGMILGGVGENGKKGIEDGEEDK